MEVSIDIYRPEDLAGVLELLADTLHADTITEADFIHKVLLDPLFRPESAPVARAGGRIVGFMLGLAPTIPAERGWVTLFAVRKGRRREGIGSMLLARTMRELKSVKSIWISPYAPGYFSPGVDEVAYPEAVEFLSHRGFSTAYRPLSMECRLGNVEAHTALGVEIHNFDTKHILPLFDLLRRDFSEDWQRIFADAVMRIVEGLEPPDTMQIAMAGERCVGFARHGGERFGPFGVAESERGRGIGGALLSHTLAAMQKKGFRRAWLMWTDDRAAKTYMRAGFVETRRFSVVQRSTA